MATPPSPPPQTLPPSPPCKGGARDKTAVGPPDPPKSTVSTPGCWSSVFNTTPKELLPLDELLVPSSSAAVCVTPAKPRPVTRTTSQDFDKFIDSILGNLQPSGPSSNLTEDSLELEGDWMNQCFEPSDFEKHIPQDLTFPLEDLKPSSDLKELSLPPSPSPAPSPSACPPASRSSSPSSSQSKFAKYKPSKESKPDEYLRYRKQNNEAACKSRLRRKEKEKQNEELVKSLTAENTELRNQLLALQIEYKRLQMTLDSHLSK